MNELLNNWVKKSQLLGDEVVVIEAVDGRVILKHLDTKSKRLVIPGFIDKIAPGAFRFNDDYTSSTMTNQNLREVIIETGVKEIGNIAFNQDIQHVVVPKSVKRLVNSTFYMMDIEKITFQGSIVIDSGAIEQLNNLEIIEGSEHIAIIHRGGIQSVYRIMKLDLRKCVIQSHALSDVFVNELIIGEKTGLYGHSFGTTTIGKLVVHDIQSLKEANDIVNILGDTTDSLWKYESIYHNVAPYVEEISMASRSATICTIELHYTENGIPGIIEKEFRKP